MTNTQFEKMTLRQKAYYPFTDLEWSKLSRDQKKRVFFARHKFATETKING